MRILILLIFFGLVVAGGFLFAFFWAVKSGQFDDQETPAMRILFDDTMPGTEKEKQEAKEQQEKESEDDK